MNKNKLYFIAGTVCFKYKQSVVILDRYGYLYWTDLKVASNVEESDVVWVIYSREGQERKPGTVMSISQATVEDLQKDFDEERIEGSS